MRPIQVCVALILSLLPARALADESYYVVVFGAQRPVIDVPQHTHSWAVFVRVADDPRRPGFCTVEPHTVSWLAANWKVRPLKPFPEPGVNLDLHTTFQWACEERVRVSMWGPFQINQCLFDRALAKKARLESGAVRYKAADIGQDLAEVSNCVHALSDISEGKRLRVIQSSWGEPASYFITLSYRKYMIDEHRIHDWLLAPLGLCHYPVVRRDLDRNPSTNPLVRGVQNLIYSDLRR